MTMMANRLGLNSFMNIVVTSHEITSNTYLKQQK